MQTFSPQRGSPTPQCEQDFCNGANALNTLHPAYSTPSTSIYNEHHLDEWMEMRSSLGCDGLEIFNDVILFEDAEFQPENLLQDLKSNEIIENENNNYLNHFNFLEPQQSENETSKPKFTIKLKKVKCSKNKNYQSQSFNSTNFQIVNNINENDFLTEFNDIPSVESVSSTHSFNDVSSNAVSPIQCFNDVDSFIVSPNQSFNELDSNAVSPTHCFNDIDSMDSNILSNSQLITLKEALDMDNADRILENCLSTDTLSSQDPSEYSDSSTWEDDTQSLGLTSSGFASPCSDINLSHYYIKDETIVLDVQDMPSSSSKKRSRTQKGKIIKARLSPESRYIRKKEQNKQAALRYRAKKKQEEELLSDALKAEEKEKDELNKKCSSLEQEIFFLKKLMRETFIAKKLVSPDAFL